MTIPLLIPLRDFCSWEPARPRPGDQRQAGRTPVAIIDAMFSFIK
jgi:hypothetical protein